MCRDEIGGLRDGHPRVGERDGVRRGLRGGMTFDRHQEGEKIHLVFSEVPILAAEKAKNIRKVMSKEGNGSRWQRLSSLQSHHSSRRELRSGRLVC